MTRVQFRWERRPSQPTADVLRRTVVGALRCLEVSEAEVHVLITGDARMRELNRVYRDTDRTTDVLSFPDGADLPTGRTLLGQIVISLDTARHQAERLGHEETRELQELVLHGVVHLLGYDHMHDDGEMNALELRLREEVLG